MPERLLEQFASQMRRLEAQEALRTYMAVALGSGNVKKMNARSIIRAWQRQAAGGQSQGVYKPKTKEEHAMLLASIGITVED